jgi:hypothetical protein
MLDTIRSLANRASVSIKVHNSEQKPILREVLMTLQQIIADKDQVIAKFKVQQATEKD